MGMIQIRNVPPELHLKLKARAAKLGLSLSDYLLQGAEREVARPTMEEMLDRLAKLPRIDTPESAADAVRAERDGR
jgi:plasmid stability protein